MDDKRSVRSDGIASSPQQLNFIDDLVAASQLEIVLYFYKTQFYATVIPRHEADWRCPRIPNQPILIGTLQKSAVPIHYLAVPLVTILAVIAISQQLEVHIEEIMHLVKAHPPSSTGAGFRQTITSVRGSIHLVISLQIRCLASLLNHGF